MRSTTIFFLFFLLVFPIALSAQQPFVIDQVLAVVGSKDIKQSDVENEYMQVRSQGVGDYEALKCEIFESILKQKLLVNQAMLDSIVIPESQVDGELSQRLTTEINRLGSADKIEKQYNKSISQIKEDMRENMREMLLVQKMQQNIVEKMKITPTEVSKFFNKIPKDSIPTIDAQLEFAQLAMYPAYSEKSVLEVKDKLLDLRKRILGGENFGALAGFYSEDPGTAIKGGETGFLAKADFDDPVLAKAAFGLNKQGDVSRIVESKFGYQIIQLIEHRGDRVNTRQILMKPKPDPDAVFKVRNTLDSIATLIRKGTITFDDAVKFYSMDPDTRYNKGLVVNPATGGTKFNKEQLSAADYYVVKNLKVGELSTPYESRDKTNKFFYKIVILKSQIPSHKANLQADYDMIQDIAKNQKRMTVLNNWFAQKIETTYIRINDPSFKSCKFSIKGWLKAGM
jgi:peptidyl-prolyl cis-trans isomerase SurA